MLENQMTLITILNEVISTNNEKIEELSTPKISATITYKKELKNLRENITNLIDFNLDIIREILEETNITILEQDKIYNYFKAVKELLILNKSMNTTYNLYESQLQYIDMFFKYVDELPTNKISKSSNEKEVEELKNSNIKYNNILKQLEDENDKNYIEDLDTIKLLLNNCNMSRQNKREILVNLMRYNKDCYNN